MVEEIVYSDIISSSDGLFRDVVSSGLDPGLDTFDRQFR
jgi:hypothetical protein